MFLIARNDKCIQSRNVVPKVDEIAHTAVSQREASLQLGAGQTGSCGVGPAVVDICFCLLLRHIL